MERIFGYECFTQGLKVAREATQEFFVIGQLIWFLFFTTEIDTSSKFKYKKNPYIPLIKTPDIYNYGPTAGANQQVKDSDNQELNEVEPGRIDDSLNFVRRRRSHGHNATASNETSAVSNATKSPIELWKPAASHQNVVIYTKDEQIVVPSVPQAVAIESVNIHDKPVVGHIPHFHVSYWMFYPFSQGKTVCTLNLGPLGPIPIPLVPIFNICLGTKKEFGSHVGDWEHMSLFFRGRMEPDVSLLRNLGSVSYRLDILGDVRVCP